jgi:acyl-CoA hydrolase
MNDALAQQGYTLTSRKLVMYPDLNAAGRLFGGMLMSWIDEASAMMAMSIMRTKSLVTKKFGEVIFEAPGRLGDVVEIWCKTAREGTTSLTLDCKAVVWGDVAEASRTEPREICRSTVVYVALDENGRPQPWRRG